MTRTCGAEYSSEMILDSRSEFAGADDLSATLDVVVA